MNEFYLTLPWNNKQYESSNTRSMYKVPLPELINLKDTEKWSVALTDFIYPSTILILKDAYMIVDNNARRGGELSQRKIKIPPTPIKNIQDLVQHLTTLIQIEFSNKTEAARFEIVYIEAIRRIHINLDVGCQLILSPELAYVLGFGHFPEGLDFKDRHAMKAQAAYSPDIYNGIYSLCVYCNVASSMIVGDTYAPLLKIIKRESSNDPVISVNIVRPTYIPLSSHSFSSIEINIRSSSGDLINFGQGDSICVLHFKKKTFLES